ncbi:uncharacterized protein PAC_10194 [Phialocephala subalpina]|uniref:Uncharacterized protein n=1 Tax=Phialocephala subalpina TaxID=576137 RepID=A0A1L7X5J7_9HELO|nr:uncharacterized protein PAC_10194 [Phialocephala subalpina]
MPPPKTYFLVPTRDSPPSGPIFLGSIIKSPRSPELCINSKTSPLLTSLEIHEKITTDETRHLYRDSKGKVSLFAEFLSGLPLGLDASVGTNWDNGEFAKYAFKELVTKQIFPSQGEIALIFKDEAIQGAIKDSRFRDNLYMITGVKIARGADVLIGKLRERGGNLHFGADLTPVSVPIKVGPDLDVTRGHGQSVEEKHAGEFVFAYRLREIKYRRRKVEEQREYLKGDLFGHNEGKGWGKGEKVEVEEEAELIGLGSGDVGVEDWDAEDVEAVDDDGEEVRCVVFEDEIV